MQIVVDGLITEYRKSGKGPVMLMLHGWGDTHKTFDMLAGHFEGTYTCLCLDLPGFGGSEVPEGTWGLGDYAAFVQHFLQKQKVAKIDVLVGHSNGAAVAIKGLESGVLTASRLVLLSAAGIRPKKTIKTTFITWGAKAGKQLTRLLPKANQRALRKAVYRKLGSDYLAVPQMAETFKKVVREDISAGLGKVTIPVLLVYGAEDTDTPLWIARRFEKLLPDATLHVAPLAGHFVHHDALAETVKAMKVFLG
jgi:pimeloyl-ACP methyl ester carboxylesterase